MSAELADAPVMHCAVTQVGHSQYFSTEDVAAIRGRQLDVVLRFGFGIVRGPILDVATYGVWSFHHDDEEVYRGGPACFWEMYFGDPVTGFVLQRLTNRLDAGVILRKGHLNTVFHSHSRQIDRVYFQSAKLAAIVARELLDGLPLPSSRSRTRAPIYKYPSNAQMCVFVWRRALAFLRHVVEAGLHREHWSVAIVDAPIESFLGLDRVPAARVLKAGTSDRFVADPFYVPDAHGDEMVLCEEFDYATRRGVIRALSIADGDVDPQICLDVPFHASYPFVLSDGPDLYCVPETKAAREVSLYRIGTSPVRLQRVRALVTGVAAADPTLFRHDDLWWLAFCEDDVGSIAALHLWYSSSLEDEFQPHRRNPVKIDVRSARPAGTPFSHEGHLYRPAQDCSRTYGGRIALNRILELNPTSFREEPVHWIGPARDRRLSHGVHTISAASHRTLVDGKQFIFDPAAMMGVIRRRSAARRADLR